MKVIQVDDNACADHLVDEWFETVKDLEEVGFSTSTQFQKLKDLCERLDIVLEEVKGE